MKEFYDSLRKAFGPLSENQVSGLSQLLTASEGLTLRHRAYILATAWHETGPEDSALHMTPRREIWGPTKAQLGYEGRADLGNTIMGDGKRYAGRGFCQITGRRNFERASSLTGRDLVGNPDLALDPHIAALIMVDGMRRGWFTGKKMADYANYKDMRRVVNGTDRADLIAGYADRFETALNAIKVSAPAPAPVPPSPAPIPPPPDIEPLPVDAPEAPPGKGVAGWIIAAIAAAASVFAAWMMKG
jgi:putative chitinase